MKKPLNKSIKIEDSIVSVIVVSSDDEDIIGERLENVYKVLSELKINFEILVVDNSSLDRTVEIIKGNSEVMKHTRVLILSKKYDKEVAFTAGLDNCIGDYAVMLNIYTDPPEIIKEMLDKLLENKDIILGKNRDQFDQLEILSKLFMHLIQRFSTHGFYYRQNNLIALNRRVINSILRIRRKSRNFSYINSLIGFKKESINYKQIKRFKYKIKRETFLEVFFSVINITISNSFKPIRLLSFLGMFLSGLFLLYVFIVVVLILVFHMRNLAPQGWISVATVIGLMFFLLFSLLTLMSEYILRILSESRNEPFYFISEEINQSVILPKNQSLNIL